MTLRHRKTSNQRRNNVVFVTTLDNVESTLLFSTSCFTTLINVEKRCEYDHLQKVEKTKNIFELQKK